MTAQEWEMENGTTVNNGDSIWERMSVEGARSALNGYKDERWLRNDLDDEEWDLYEQCYEYWSQPENRSLAERVAK